VNKFVTTNYCDIMRILKQEIYFPIIIGIHFIIWAVDLSMYNGGFMEVSSDTLFFGELTNESWLNIHRILGEVLSSWVVTVFAANFLMATRAKWVEKLFGGLDKMYLIHRRSGIIAVILLIAHFCVVPRDLTAFTVGKPLGFYALILILIGVFLSAAPPMKKKIPYHKWINFHKLMGVFYVMAVIHGFMVKSLIQELPMTRAYVFGMAFIGISAWFYRAFLFKTFNKSLDYSVNSVSDLGHGITEIEMRSKGQSLSFSAGQFAFFRFDSLNKREQHPFTISSHPDEESLRITVKNLGDYTSQMNEINVGDNVSVEGPYGLFSTRFAKEKDQIWIAGGIGITPFLSLIIDVYPNKTQLIWCVNTQDEAVYASELESLASQKDNCEFSVWSTSENGYLSIEDLNLENPNSKAYYICGPKALKDSIIPQLLAIGVKRKDIYDEEFSFR